jgi:hypothetical protein
VKTRVIGAGKQEEPVSQETTDLAAIREELTTIGIALSVIAINQVDAAKTARSSQHEGTRFATHADRGALTGADWRNRRNGIKLACQLPDRMRCGKARQDRPHERPRRSLDERMGKGDR